MLDRRKMIIGLSLTVAACATPIRIQGNQFMSDRLSVTTVGSGPDVILVPGLGSSSQIWAEVVGRLPGYRFHLVQLNGFAGRPPIGNVAGPVIASAAEEIGRYMREAGLTKPAIVGHSLGGTIALSVAARTQSVSKVMVVDMLPYLGVLFAPPGSGPDAVRATADKIRDQSLAATEEQRRATVEAGIATMVIDEGLRPLPTRHALESDRAVMARAFHELIVTDLRPELSKIQVPVTVLYVKTPNVPLNVTQFDALYRTSYAALPMATLKRIDNSYHFIMLDQPERFAAELRAFLE